MSTVRCVAHQWSIFVCDGWWRRTLQLSGASLIDGRFLFVMVGGDAPYNYNFKSKI
ncbi:MULTISPECIES: hypothetical protein [unclassified Microcoleus]|uniref:hypothetical protein n=1 Tax=unclassified Microcoleus TaxID=2642155 RepID=UPI002FCF05AB